MELFQILDCSTIGTCCTDYSLVAILNITRKIFELIQIIVPIALIIACTVQFVQLSINPEMKDGFRRILNKFIAAIIVFAVPFLVDAILTAVPGNLNISSCWQQAKLFASENMFNSGTYYDDSSEKKKVFDDLGKYEKPKSGTTPTTPSGTSSKRKEIVDYAVSFANKGNKYKSGCNWHGGSTYKPSDCIGFVKGVYENFGFKNMKNAPCGTRSFYKARKGIVTEISEKDLQPGDIVLWETHIAIYIGNGKIVHSANHKLGVITQKMYNKNKVRGYFRVNGLD